MGARQDSYRAFVQQYPDDAAFGYGTEGAAYERAQEQWRDDDSDGRDDATGMAWGDFVYQQAQALWEENGIESDGRGYTSRARFDEEYRRSGLDLADGTRGFTDNNRDGIDDETGLTKAQHDARVRVEREDRSQWVDENHDGLHDETFQSRAEFDEEVNALGLESSAQRDERIAGEERAARIAERERQATDDYYTSGERTEDLDSGRSLEHSDRSGEDLIFGQGQGPGHIDANDFDTASQYIPLWNDLTGAGERVAAIEAYNREQEQKQMWARLIDSGYAANDLAVTYDQSRFVDNPEFQGVDQATIDAQMDALHNLQDVYRQGGLTDADRARMELGRSQAGQAARAQREADMAALEARGMGGSGALQASMMGANQGFTQSMADADLQMQIAAQQRALQAMTGAAGVAGQARGQSLGEANAVNDFNQWATGREQDWVEKNTDRANQTKESLVDARKYTQDFRKQAVSGAAGQYQSDQATQTGIRREGQDDQTEAGKGLANALGHFIDL